MPGFWDDNVQAQALLKEKGQLERVVREWQSVRELADDVETLIELSIEMDDGDTAAEAVEQVTQLGERIRYLKTRRLL